MTADNTIDIEEVARALEVLFFRLAAAGEGEPDRAIIWENLQDQFPAITLASDRRGKRGDGQQRQRVVREARYFGLKG
jgi:hypothetical protein